ncbi:fimbrial protein [Escherichia coli]|nr:fimbrial protein [Escherichia coli]EER1731251.1 fimbrial protein [Escherichia coli]EFA3048683.1 fimbrial protein [Escherichia coli]
MKLKHVGMIVVSVLAMSSAAVSAAEGDESVTTTVNGGVIHFKGEVVNAACAIDSESMNQTVELGQVRSSRLAKAGDLSSAVGFNIKLNDCDTNVSSNAAVAFLGTTVTSNDDTLALQSSAAGSAQKLRFRRSGSKLTLINPTPYFITVTNMKAGNSNLPNTMVPPKGEVSVDITHAATGDISFQTINDYGALTPRIKATMQ